MKVTLAQRVGSPVQVEADVSGVWALHDCTVTHVPTGTRVCFGAQTGRVAAEKLWAALADAWPDYGASAAFAETDATRVDARWAAFGTWFHEAARKAGVAL